MKKTLWNRFIDFADGKGFYIVLFLCIAALGISGYYFVSTLNSIVEPEHPLPASGQTSVTVTPAPHLTPRPDPRPFPPSVSSTPAPEQETADTSAVLTSPVPSPSVTVTSSVFTWPLRGKILSDFSVEALSYDVTMGDWRTHSGLDIAASPGTAVRSAAGGTVIDIVDDPLMGTTVYLDHGNGITSVYSNLAAVPVVAVGDVVSTGTVLGSVGKTAIAESSLPSHLHFEMAEHGTPADPRDFLP